MEKALTTGADPELALLHARITPVDNELPSPSKMLYGRNITTNLPSQHHGKPNIITVLEKRQTSQKKYYDQTGTKDLKELKVGQTIGLQNPNSLRWSKGTVVTKCVEPRAYMVRTDTGNCVRRNRRFLRDLGNAAVQGGNAETGQGDNVESGQGDNVDSNADTSQAVNTHHPGSPKADALQPGKGRPSRSIVKPKRLIESI